MDPHMSIEMIQTKCVRIIKKLTIHKKIGTGALIYWGYCIHSWMFVCMRERERERERESKIQRENEPKNVMKIDDIKLTYKSKSRRHKAWFDPEFESGQNDRITGSSWQSGLPDSSSYPSYSERKLDGYCECLSVPKW